MKRLAKILTAIGVMMLLLMPFEQAAGWWGGGPWYGSGWRHAYVHDPAYIHAPPAVKRYIRDLYRYGPAYADWNRWRHWW
jgi:hypothetical protein